MQPDPALPAVRTLLGPESAALVAAALEPFGDTVRNVRPTQVRYEPGRRITVRYATTLLDARGVQRVDTVVAAVHRDGPPDGVAVLAGRDGHAVGVWRYPNDPYLPGLPTLTDPAGAGHVLAQLGLDGAHPDVRPVVYRPGQRAVLRVEAGGAVLYAKLVRPHRAEAIQRAHAVLAAHAPVPRSLGWSAAHGLVLLEGLPGERLADRLAGGGALPPPRALLALLDDLAAAPAPAGAHTPGRAVASHADLLRAIVPSERGLVRAVERFAAAADLPADRTVHGDLYEGQLLVSDATHGDGGGHGPPAAARITGVLDVDGARRGSAVDDLATLVAHLDGLALVRPAAAARIIAYRRQVEALAAARVDPVTLAAATAGVLLGLATGPFRLQQNDWPAATRSWLRLARRWLRRASPQGGERPLTQVSWSPHVPGAA